MFHARLYHIPSHTPKHRHSNPGHHPPECIGITECYLRPTTRAPANSHAIRHYRRQSPTPPPRPCPGDPAPDHNPGGGARATTDTAGAKPTTTIADTDRLIPQPASPASQRRCPQARETHFPEQHPNSTQFPSPLALQANQVLTAVLKRRERHQQKRYFSSPDKSLLCLTSHNFYILCLKTSSAHQ